MAVNARLFIRQTWALTKKTLIIAVVRNWVSTALRALILPTAFLVLLLNIKTSFSDTVNLGLAAQHQYKALQMLSQAPRNLSFCSLRSWARCRESGRSNGQPFGRKTARLPYRPERPPKDMQTKFARRLKLLCSCGLQ
jgi:hypothetical protein